MTNVDFCQGQSEDLPFTDECFDIVISIEVFEHVENLEETLNEIFLLLKPNGILLVSVPDRGFPFLTHHRQIGRF